MGTVKVKNHLRLGILGALVTVTGELLQGAVAAPDTANEMVRLFSTIEVLPVWRIGLGSTLGGLGILLQWFGFQAVCLTFDNETSRLAKACRVGNIGFTVIGAMVHILLSVWMYVYKFTSPLGMFRTYMTEFSVWFVLPITAVFFAAYGLFAISLFIQFFKKHTPFPKWCWVLNPIAGKLLINIATALLPNTAIVNGIGFADMGLTSLVTFIALYILCRKHS